MDITPQVDLIRGQLAAVGGIGGPETLALVDRLADAIEQAARLAVQSAVATAAEEISQELAPGSVDVRLRGRDLDFVVTLPEARPADAIEAPSWQHSAPEPSTDLAAESGTARISFRPPEALKVRIEQAAERAGLSVNAFLVTTLTTALASPGPGATPTTASADVSGRRAAGWFQ